MRMVLSVAGKDVILTTEQMSKVIDVIAGAEMFKRDYTGCNGPDPWIDMIVRTELKDVTSYFLDDVTYESRKLVTKLHTEKKSK